MLGEFQCSFLCSYPYTPYVCLFLHFLAYFGTFGAKKAVFGPNLALLSAFKAQQGANLEHFALILARQGPWNVLRARIAQVVDTIRDHVHIFYRREYVGVADHGPEALKRWYSLGS